MSLVVGQQPDGDELNESLDNSVMNVLSSSRKRIIPLKSVRLEPIASTRRQNRKHLLLTSAATGITDSLTIDNSSQITNDQALALPLQNIDPPIVVNSITKLQEQEQLELKAVQLMMQDKEIDEDELFIKLLLIRGRQKGSYFVRKKIGDIHNNIRFTLEQHKFSPACDLLNDDFVDEEITKPIAKNNKNLIQNQIQNSKLVRISYKLHDCIRDNGLQTNFLSIFFCIALVISAIFRYESLNETVVSIQFPATGMGHIAQGLLITHIGCYFISMLLQYYTYSRFLFKYFLVTNILFSFTICVGIVQFAVGLKPLSRQRPFGLKPPIIDLVFHYLSFFISIIVTYFHIVFNSNAKDFSLKLLILLQKEPLSKIH